MKKCYIGFFLGLLLAVSCQKNDTIKQVDDVCTMMDDIAFMKYCYDSFDVNHDGKVSMEEALAVTEIRINDKGIKSLKGINYFANLTLLHCSLNQLTEIDISKNIKLKDLQVKYNQLTALDVSNNTDLENLYCSDNNIRSLDVSKNTRLFYLRCAYNQLRSLDVTNNPQLTVFSFNPQQGWDITPTGWPK